MGGLYGLPRALGFRVVRIRTIPRTAIFGVGWIALSLFRLLALGQATLAWVGLALGVAMVLWGISSRQVP